MEAVKREHVHGSHTKPSVRDRPLHLISHSQSINVVLVIATYSRRKSALCQDAYITCGSLPNVRYFRPQLHTSTLIVVTSQVDTYPASMGGNHRPEGTCTDRTLFPRLFSLDAPAGMKLAMRH